MVGFPDDASLVSVDVSLPQEYDRFLQRQLARHQKTDVPEIPKMIFPYINPSLAGGVHPYSYPAYSGVGYNLVDWSEFGGGIADGFNSTIDGVKYLFTHPGDSIIHLSKMASTNPLYIPYKFKVSRNMISDIVTYTTENSGSRVAGRAGYEIIVTGLGAKGVTSAPKLVKGIQKPKTSGTPDAVWRGSEIVDGRTVVSDIGMFGEHIAESMLVKNAWKDFTYIKNGSDNGIDIIARGPNGQLGLFEVKTSSTGKVPTLSSRQANMNTFVEDVLSNAANGTGRYKNIDGDTRKAAQNIYNEYLSNPNNISGNVIGVDLKSGIIKISRWER